MDSSVLILTMASIVLASTPLIIAVCGEILTERSGIVNLSLDGSMLMAAMTGFVVAFETDNIWFGFLAGAAIGAFFAFIVAFGSIRLRQSQFAIGFVLTLLGDDLSAFLGQNYTRIPGPIVTHYPISSTRMQSFILPLSWWGSPGSGFSAPSRVCACEVRVIVPKLALPGVLELTTSVTCMRLSVVLWWASQGHPIP